MNSESNVYFLPPKQINPERPLFVYLPGMDGTGSLFQSQANRLAASFDLRCVSLRVDSLGNWDDLAAETVQLIKSEITNKPNRSVYLCGESFGGCLAIKTALMAPFLIDKLILVNPASCFNQYPLLGWGVNITPWLPDWVHRYSAAGLLPFLARLNRIKDCDRNCLVKSMRSLPPQIVSWRLSLLRDFLVSEAQLRQLTMPSLIIASAADSLLPSVSEAEKLVKVLPHAKMTVLPQSGHACLLETEVNLYQILLEQNFIPAQTRQMANLAS